MADVQVTFDPTAWLAEAEGEHGYRFYLADARQDGHLWLYVEDLRGEPDSPPPTRSRDDLWAEFQPVANERALRAHLAAIGRVAGSSAPGTADARRR